MAASEEKLYPEEADSNSWNTPDRSSRFEKAKAR